MKIIKSRNENLPEFQRFWDAALAYQKGKGLPVWPEFPQTLLSKEIEMGLHYSAYSPDEALVGCFSLALVDPVIWEEEENGDAIYIHRMCVNPDARGKGLAKDILIWAHGYAAGAGRKYIRMDTWGMNRNLIHYYISSGFHYLKSKQIGASPQLLAHYDNIKLAMFQNEV